MFFDRSILLLALFSAVSVTANRFNEIKILPGHTKRNNFQLPQPHEYVKEQSLPDSFSWGDIDGVSYLTHSLNQHLPQYCGSCWAHGAMSALADRIKIARGGRGDDINLSIQFILNCGGGVAGSCHGGYHTGVYQMIHDMGYAPYDTCQPYMACSAESKEGICPHLDTSCSNTNICRTCDTFGTLGGKCTEIDYFPNATVAEYGEIELNIHKIMAEIYVRGPVAATINAEPIVDYKKGVFTDDSHSQDTNHIVSIVGWGTDEESDKKHWIIRNSWGQYWGELGFMRLEMGKNLLGIEEAIAWATPGTFTIENYPCAEDGKNCNGKEASSTPGAHQYVDPSWDIKAVQSRLEKDSRRVANLRTA